MRFVRLFIEIEGERFVSPNDWSFGLRGISSLAFFYEITELL
jgi:hypothetical protein